MLFCAEEHLHYFLCYICLWWKANWKIPSSYIKFNLHMMPLYFCQEQSSCLPSYLSPILAMRPTHDAHSQILEEGSSVKKCFCHSTCPRLLTLNSSPLLSFGTVHSSNLPWIRQPRQPFNEGRQVRYYCRQEPMQEPHQRKHLNKAQ